MVRVHIEACSHAWARDRVTGEGLTEGMQLVIRRPRSDVISVREGEGLEVRLRGRTVVRVGVTIRRSVMVMLMTGDLSLALERGLDLDFRTPRF